MTLQELLKVAYESAQHKLQAASDDKDRAVIGKSMEFNMLISTNRAKLDLLDEIERWLREQRLIGRKPLWSRGSYEPHTMLFELRKPKTYSKSRLTKDSPWAKDPDVSLGFNAIGTWILEQCDAEHRHCYSGLLSTLESQELLAEIPIEIIVTGLATYAAEHNLGEPNIDFDHITGGSMPDSGNESSSPMAPAVERAPVIPVVAVGADPQDSTRVSATFEIMVSITAKDSATIDGHLAELKAIAKGLGWTIRPTN